MNGSTRREIARLAERYTPDMVQFLRDMIAIPSESTGERQVIERARAEMEQAGFDEIKGETLRIPVRCDTLPWDIVVVRPWGAIFHLSYGEGKQP